MSLELAIPLVIVSFVYPAVFLTKGQRVDYILYALAVIVGVGATAYTLGQFERIPRR